MSGDVCIIAAIEEQSRAIGRGNELLWRIPEDLKRFRRLTLGNTIIMGRKTFESLGRRPLTGRNNLVVSRTMNQVPGIKVYNSIRAALDAAGLIPSAKIFVIGGGEIFEATLAHADILYLTLVHDPGVRADIFFPEYAGAFTRVLSSRAAVDSKFRARFLTLARMAAVD